MFASEPRLNASDSELPCSLSSSTLRICCYYSFFSNIGSWSASTSPARSPSPSRFGVHSSAQHRSRKDRPKNHLAHQPYDTTILYERSRSPSPASLLQELRDRDHVRRKYRNGMGTGHFLSVFSLSLSASSHVLSVPFIVPSSDPPEDKLIQSPTTHLSTFTLSMYP